MTVQPTHVTLWGRGPDGSLTVVADGTATWTIEDGLFKVGYAIRYRGTKPVQPVDGVMPTYLDEKGLPQPTGSFWSRKEGRGRAGSDREDLRVGYGEVLPRRAKSNHREGLKVLPWGS